MTDWNASFSVLFLCSQARLFLVEEQLSSLMAAKAAVEHKREAKLARLRAKFDERLEHLGDAPETAQAQFALQKLYIDDLTRLCVVQEMYLAVQRTEMARQDTQLQAAKEHEGAMAAKDAELAALQVHHNATPPPVPCHSSLFSVPFFCLVSHSSIPPRHARGARDRLVCRTPRWPRT